MRKILSPILALITAHAIAQTLGSEAPSGARVGIAWGMVYGQPFSNNETFLPEIRKLGGGFAKVVLFWSQLEPARDVYHWEPLDALLSQIANPEEAIVTIYSSSPWATRTATWAFPPSPAKDPARYSRFVTMLVARPKGKIRYYQNGSEPNQAMFWSGTQEEFLDQSRAFSTAVRRADPKAQIVLAGSDGLFDLSTTHHIPGQEVGLSFFEYLLDHGKEAFDFFDLHLYADPYTIPARVQYFRNKMAALGYQKPIICTEYNGPGFFEFPANARYFPLLAAMGTAKEKQAVTELYERSAALPAETRMFLQDAPEELQRRLQALQARDLLIRNVLAFSAGVQKTAFWDLWHDSTARDQIRTVMFGKLKLMEFVEGKPAALLPLAENFRKMASQLAHFESVERLETGSTSVFVFRIRRSHQPNSIIGWTRSNMESCLTVDGFTFPLCFGPEPRFVEEATVRRRPGGCFRTPSRTR